MSEKNNKLEDVVPVLVLDQAIIFPSTYLSIELPKTFVNEVVEKFIANDREIFVCLKKPQFQFEKEVKIEHLEKYGTFAKIIDIVEKGNEERFNLLFYGINRFEVLSLETNKFPLYAKIRHEKEFLLDEEPSKNILEKAALAEILNENVEQFLELMKVPDKTRKLFAFKNLANTIAEFTSRFVYSYELKKSIFESKSIRKASHILLEYIIAKIEVLSIKKDLQETFKSKLDKNQKEYYLREQLKVIQEELGEESPLSEIEEFKQKLEERNFSDDIKNKISKEIRRLKLMQSSSHEANVLRNYLDLVFELPFNKESTDNKDIKLANKVLDEEHYGLKKVKERLLEYFAVKILNPNMNAPILCLVGPPGTGKTSIAKSIAKALSRKYVRISLGGVSDEAEIRGHRKTYVGAMPGRIVEALRSANVINPLILLDELDKTASSYKGDISSSLLEVLDIEQNKSFRDNFLEIPIDLSKVLFIATANYKEQIPRPLLDRLEIIELNSYTETEKYHIAKDYLIKKVLNENGLKKSQVSISDEAIIKIIRNYTKEAGVRNLERELSKIFRKVAIKILEGRKTKLVINEKSLENYLGKEIFTFDKIEDMPEIGMVNGLAYTIFGGDTLKIEVLITKGKGKVLLTGNMGEVMKESANIAFTVARYLASSYGLDEKEFDEKDIHLHIPMGAIKKDGPSAGITMCTAILSAITNKKVRQDIAMTGELNLRAKLCPIGGLKEKLLAAKFAGIKIVIVPFDNKKDVEELESEIVDGLEIKYLKTMKEVLDIVLVEDN